MCCFFNDTATTEIYTHGHTLSLHDALPISSDDTRRSRVMKANRCMRRIVTAGDAACRRAARGFRPLAGAASAASSCPRSEEHTSELQSLMRISYAVFCLNKKKTIYYTSRYAHYPYHQQLAARKSNHM